MIKDAIVENPDCPCCVLYGDILRDLLQESGIKVMETLVDLHGNKQIRRILEKE